MKEGDHVLVPHGVGYIEGRILEIYENSFASVSELRERAVIQVPALGGTVAFAVYYLKPVE